MWKYILKRILIMIPMMIAVTFIIYALVSLSSVDPTRLILGPEATEVEIAALRESLHLDDNLIVRYLLWLKDAVHGDFGDSWYYTGPAFDYILARWPNTILLTLLSMAIAMLIGIPLGVLSAVKQYSLADRVLTTLSMVLAAIPTFCIATIFVIVFSLNLKLVPASGVTEGWRSWILPALTLGISYSAQFLRFTRSNMLETIRMDYIRTIRSKGVAERDTIWKHAFRNTLIPLITISGTTLGQLLGGAVIMEAVFVIPGLGTLVLNAINQYDVPIVMGAVSMLAFTFMVIMLAVDLLYAVVDPRMRARYGVRKKKSSVKGGVTVG